MASKKYSNDPQLAPLIQAQSQLDSAKKAYDEKVKQAKTALAQAQKAHKGLVGMAHDKLDAENKHWTTPIGSFAGSKLYYSHLSFGTEDLPLSDQVTTNLEVGANVVLTISNGQQNIRLTSETKELQKARDYSDQIRHVAAEAAQTQAAHEKNVAVLTDNLTQISHDTTQIDQAQKDLYYAQAQQGPIQAASLKVSEVRSHINPDVLKKYDERGRRKPGALMPIIILILILILIVMSVLYALLL